MKHSAGGSKRKATTPVVRNLYHSLLEDGCFAIADARKNAMTRQQPGAQTQTRHARLQPERWI